ncbi:MAG: hypothetical protein QCI38_03585, partial [Candidatus Thermoplasmatota archaeon]|nr:hypothetical protein [Candidatus Thermoplasmatota archaeon]
GIKGYAWLFPKPGYLNIGYGAFQKDMKNLDVHKTFDSLVGQFKKLGLMPEKLPDVRLIGLPIPLRGPVRKTFSHRMLALGDSAGFVSPIGGDGIPQAVESAHLGAKVVQRALECSDKEGKRAWGDLGQYEKLWKKRHKKEYNTLCKMADWVMAKPDEAIKIGHNDPAFWNLAIDIINGEKRASENRGKLLLGLLKARFK